MTKTTTAPLEGLDKLIAEQMEFDVDVMKSIRNRAKSLIMSHIDGSYIPELDETGWTMGGTENYYPSGNSRQDINNQAWYYFHTSPMMNHAANIHNNYTFGQGASLVVNDQDNEDLQTVVKNFWNSTSVRSTLSRAQAQYKLNLRRICDGEIFFLLVVDKLTAKVSLEFLDPRQVKNIVTERGVPMYYHVKVKQNKFDYDKGRYVGEEYQDCYIPDYRLTKPDKANYWDVLGLSQQQEAYVYHALFNDFNGRGLSAFATALPWLRAFTGFMEDRITIQLAIATFAFKMKLKGGKNTLNRMMSEYASLNQNVNRYGESPTAERAMGGATWFENDQINLEKMDMDTGAGSAYTDARLIRQMVGVGTQLMEHYITGDPSFANLATATAMELPLLKTFEGIQQFWSDVTADIVRFVVYTNLRFKKLKPSLAKITVDASGHWDLEPQKPDANSAPYDLTTTLRFPPIVTRDATMWIQSINGLLSAMSIRGEDVLPMRPIAVTLLELMGLEDAESVYNEFVEDMEQMKQDEPTDDEPVVDDTEDQAMVDIDPQSGNGTGTTNQGSNGNTYHPPIVLNVNGSPVPPEILTTLATVAGEPLDDDEATTVEPFTDDELDEALEEWIALPELAKILDDLGVDENELED